MRCCGVAGLRGCGVVGCGVVGLWGCEVVLCPVQRTNPPFQLVPASRLDWKWGKLFVFRCVEKRCNYERHTCEVAMVTLQR